MAAEQYFMVEIIALKKLIVCVLLAILFGVF